MKMERKAAIATIIKFVTQRNLSSGGKKENRTFIDFNADGPN